MIDIATPDKYPNAYDVDWRNSIAKAVVDTDFITMYLRDTHVEDQVRYLSALDNPGVAELITYDSVFGGDTFYSFFGPVLKANDIYAAGVDKGLDTRYKIEALLLCPEVTYDIIARLFDLSSDAVESYEKIFFNIRDEAGKLKSSKGVIEFFSVVGDPSQASTVLNWKAIAFQQGFRGLMAYWNWPADELIPEFNDTDMALASIRLVYKCLYDRLQVGAIDSKTLGQLFGDLNSKFDSMRDRGLMSDAESIGEEHLMLRILECITPELAEIEGDRQKVIGANLKSKLQQMEKADGRDTEKDLPSGLAHIEQQVKIIDSD